MSPTSMSRAVKFISPFAQFTKTTIAVKRSKCCYTIYILENVFMDWLINLIGVLLEISVTHCM